MQKYSGRLFAVQVGQTISVAGRANNNPQRIDIELTQLNSDEEDAGDIQFHLSARFQPDDTSIVRNTHTRGEGWGAEEREENILPFNDSLNPLIQGGNFKIAIYVDKEAFFVSIDEKPYCTFTHRLPIVNIQKIKISGDVDDVYQVNQKSANPDLWPVINTNTFEAFAPSQFNPGNVVIITGISRGSSSGDFTVKFYDGANKVRTHFQFQAFLERQEIELNSQLENGEFGEKIIAATSSAPFSIGQSFKLAFAITESDFLVAANGERISNMAFRDDILRILGSLTGLEVISNNGLNVLVLGVDYLRLIPDCEGFERFTE